MMPTMPLLPRRAPALAWLCGALLVAACNGDRPKAAAPASPASGTAPAALPSDQQCIQLHVCDAWDGCAHIAQSGAGWKVLTANRFSAGDSIELVDVCTGEPVCIAAHATPKGVICPGHTTPLFISPPRYTCTWNVTACVATPNAKP